LRSKDEEARDKQVIAAVRDVFISIRFSVTQISPQVSGLFISPTTPPIALSR
jgi:hypothetical protein